jgi:ABC-type xylose transport system permease subunit
MAFLLIVGVLAASLVFIIALARTLFRAHANARWWLGYFVCALIGLAFGCWLTFYFEYQASPQFRFHSFPFPLGFHHLENGDWVSFVTSPHVMYPGILANLASIVAVSLLPISIARVILRRRNSQTKNESCSSPSSCNPV